MIYIYLHGFNSAYDPSAEKIKLLSTIGEVTGITYNSFGTYQEIFNEISSQVPDRDDVVFVGTSLGGFWASEMGLLFGTPSVIINPCYDPHTMLRKYVGEQHVNYQTGEQNTLGLSAVETYPVYGIMKTGAYRPLVLLDMGDEVIDSFKTSEVLSAFPMVYWADGSHRFDHLENSLQDIQEYVNHCSYAEHSE
jgi:predicted esterase YcpF (UPF0227 family)